MALKRSTLASAVARLEILLAGDCGLGLPSSFSTPLRLESGEVALKDECFGSSCTFRWVLNTYCEP